jgi:hypothetical protein
MRISRVSRHLAAAGLLLGAFALLASSASAVIVREPGGRSVSFTLTAGSNPASIPGSIASRNAASGTSGASGASGNGNLDYHGGPVLHSTAPYLIYWVPTGESIPAATRALLERYRTDAAADSGTSSNVYGVTRQFFDPQGFADYKQTFGASQIILDTDPYPARDTANCPYVAAAYPTCITDPQVQTELTSLIAARGLPVGVGANAPLYDVVTPADVNICNANIVNIPGAVCAGATSGQNGFCAYHGNFPGGGSEVLYAVIPTIFTGASPLALPKDCQADGNAAVQKPNGDLGDIWVRFLDHEDNETITDPLVGTGWFDTASGFEIGDNCEFFGSFSPQSGTNPNVFTPTLGGSAGAGTLFNQRINGNEYYIQSEWSNGNVNCRMRPSAGSMSASLAAPAGATPVGTPVTFTPTTSSTNGYSSFTIDFGDGTTSFDHSGSDPAPVSHTYSQPGFYTAKITTVDRMGNITQGSSAPFAVTAAPAPPAPASCQDPAGAYNQGFNAGFNSGFNTGFNPGFNAGFTSGFQRGFSLGFGSTATHASRGASSLASPRAIAAQALPPECNQQFNQGFNTAFNVGFNSGFNAGFNSGFASGFNPGFNAGHRARHPAHKHHRH